MHDNNSIKDRKERCKYTAINFFYSTYNDKQHKVNVIGYRVML